MKPRAFHSPALAAIVVVASACGWHAAIASAQNAAPLQPDLANVAYDNDTPAQVLDVYRAKSADSSPKPAMIYIHGGGWRGGSKARIPGFLARGVTEGWLTVVSVEYRFTDVAPHPAQVNDCARALQFVRSKAREWNIDPKRIGATGGSAGAHLSLYIGTHDDFARPDASDPVERESSRVVCVVGFAGPTDWSLLSAIEHKHPAYRQLLGYEPGTPAEKMDAAKKADVSPLTFASKDDPPTLIVHGDADDIVPLRHAEVLAEKLKAADAPVELMVVKGGNHGVAGAAGPGVPERSLAFIKEKLGAN